MAKEYWIRAESVITHKGHGFLMQVEAYKEGTEDGLVVSPDPGEALYGPVAEGWEAKGLVKVTEVQAGYVRCVEVESRVETILALNLVGHPNLPRRK